MKKILLIGDSIRMGYDKAIKKTLDGRAKVYFPEENCRFAAYLLRNIHEYQGLCEEGTFDIIHWNAGLWDCLRLFGEEPHTPKEIYAYYIERICQRIKKVYPKAKVIFATSTRVLSEQMHPDFKRYNEDIEEYNGIAVAIAKKYGFGIDDLYAVSSSLSESAHSDATHYYTPEGTEAFTKQVLSTLLPLLEDGEEVTYQEALYTDEPIGI